MIPCFIVIHKIPLFLYIPFLWLFMFHFDFIIHYLLMGDKAEVFCSIYYLYRKIWHKKVQVKRTQYKNFSIIFPQKMIKYFYHHYP